MNDQQADTFVVVAMAIAAIIAVALFVSGCFSATLIPPAICFGVCDDYMTIPLYPPPPPGLLQTLAAAPPRSTDHDTLVNYVPQAMWDCQWTHFYDDNFNARATCVQDELREEPASAY